MVKKGIFEYKKKDLYLNIMYVLDKSLANRLHDADISIVLTPSCTILLLTEQPGSYSLFSVGLYFNPRTALRKYATGVTPTASSAQVALRHTGVSA